MLQGEIGGKEDSTTDVISQMLYLQGLYENRRYIYGRDGIDGLCCGFLWCSSRYKLLLVVSILSDPCNSFFLLFSFFH